METLLITIKRNPEDRIIELGGGNNPCIVPTCQGGRDVNVDVRMTPDSQGRQTVDLVVNFEEFPWPINSEEFDGAISVYCLEHLSWRLTDKFLAEVNRIVKPGGLITFVVPNTQAQMEHILATQDWDDAGSMVFGGQLYKEDRHVAAIIPSKFRKQLTDAGFENIVIETHGAKKTDMVVQCWKATSKPIIAELPISSVEAVSTENPSTALPEANNAATSVLEALMGPLNLVIKPNQVLLPSIQSPPSPYEPALIFNRDYFNGRGPNGGYVPFYMDCAQHNITARHVLARNPYSVLELGCGRGYVMKRIQDAGVHAIGLDVSRHCYLTRVCNGITVGSAENAIPCGNKPLDLCFSQSFWEYIPEHLIPQVVHQMQMASNRGLHGIIMQDDGVDKNRCTIRPKEWWQERLPKNHEIYPAQELESGELPPDIVRGDGKVKVNLGCFMTMFHGWTNIDIHDLSQFAAAGRYQFTRHDVRQGLPWNTMQVDCIVISHLLEYLTYPEVLAFLRECRRVLKPDGVIRVACLDTAHLVNHYTEEYGDSFGKWDELSEGLANAPTDLMKLHTLLFDNHTTVWDWDTLKFNLGQAGFIAEPVQFRRTEVGIPGQQILRESLDMQPEISFYAEAIPEVG